MARVGSSYGNLKREDDVHSSPAIGSDGTVYVGSYDKKLYAIKTDSKGLAKSPWPMRGQNYTEVVGLKEVKGFEASAEKATAFGLTDNQPAKIRVFVLGEAPTSTRLKIMAFPERPGKMPNQKFIHSSIGISYLTLRVEDMTAALARLKKAKVKLLGETPASLGGNNRITVFHDPDGNFVELIGPVNE